MLRSWIQSMIRNTPSNPVMPVATANSVAWSRTILTLNRLSWPQVLCEPVERDEPSPVA
jgi:hypothetical protein